jgi:DsbC/DsbD-like thiol-disulfide interchange protein
MKTTTLLVFACALFVAPAHGQQEAPARVDVTQVGSKVGRPTTAKRMSMAHLEVVTYVSDEVVARGSVFSLVLDVTPRPGMHVYAPGATGYKVIALKLNPNPLLVTRPVHYPPPEIYYFKPLDERVPVYQKPFRLMQDMTLSTAQDARAGLAGVKTLTITGTFEYQACDDRLCYRPQSLPLTYSVKLRP